MGQLTSGKPRSHRCCLQPRVPKLASHKSPPPPHQLRPCRLRGHLLAEAGQGERLLRVVCRNLRALGGSGGRSVTAACGAHSGSWFDTKWASGPRQRSCRRGAGNSQRARRCRHSQRQRCRWRLLRLPPGVKAPERGALARQTGRGKVRARVLSRGVHSCRGDSQEPENSLQRSEHSERG